MRPNIRHFLRECAGTLPLRGPVLEVGSYQVQGQEGDIELRPLFPDEEFVGVDMRAGPGVDRVEDVMDMTFPDDSFATIVLAETLEHVEDPQRAVDEVRRVCRPDGFVIATSLMDFPIHGYPSDYWRYTPEAFRRLVRSYATSATFCAGSEDHPHTVAFVASPEADVASALRQLATRLADLDVVPPPAMGQEQRQLVQKLSRRLVHSLVSDDPVPPSPITLDWPYDRPAWTIVDGSWISGTVSGPVPGPLVAAVGRTVLAELTLTSDGPGSSRFKVQARTDGTDHVGRLEVRAGTDGDIVHRSPPGVMIGSLQRHRGFRLHALDELSRATS